MMLLKMSNIYLSNSLVNALIIALSCLYCMYKEAVNYVLQSYFLLKYCSIEVSGGGSTIVVKFIIAHCNTMGRGSTIVVKFIIAHCNTMGGGSTVVKFTHKNKTVEDLLENNIYS
jgi:hypothetical protein